MSDSQRFPLIMIKEWDIFVFNFEFWSLFYKSELRISSTKTKEEIFQIMNIFLRQKNYDICHIICLKNVWMVLLWIFLFLSFPIIFNPRSPCRDGPKCAGVPPPPTRGSCSVAPPTIRGRSPTRGRGVVRGGVGRGGVRGGGRGGPTATTGGGARTTESRSRTPPAGRSKTPPACRPGIPSYSPPLPLPPRFSPSRYCRFWD